MSHAKANTLVSLHQHRLGGGVNGYQTAGLVIDVDLVLVPEPPAWLVNSTTDFLAFVVPIPTPDEPAITQVIPRRLAVLGVEGPGRPEPVLAYIQTTEHIPFPPLDLDADADATAVFRRALETGGDHWQALIDIGVVPPEARDGLPAGLAQQAGDQDAVDTAVNGRVTRTTHTYRSRAALAADCHRPPCWPKDHATSRLFGD